MPPLASASPRRSPPNPRLRRVRGGPLLLLLLMACAPMKPGATAHGGAGAQGDDVAVEPPKPHPPPVRVDTQASAIVLVEPRDVTLVLAMETLRTHPIGQNLGPLFAVMPQWRQLVQGLVKDPIRDLDWIFVSGPSLQSTAKDAVLVRYALDDAKVDDAIDALGRSTPAVAPFDLGVQGAKGTLANLDDGARVLVRAHPSLLVLSPPEKAAAAAAVLVRSNVVAPARAGEAFRLSLKDPHAQAPQVPASVHEARVWIMPRADGGAEVFGEGDCDDDARATAAAEELKETIRRTNHIGVRIVTQNILGSTRIAHEGSKVTLHLPASREQLQATLGIVAAFLGVDISPRPAPSATSSPSSPH